MTTLVRRNILDLERAQSWHPITLAYATAIRELQGRAASNPTSWTYQAAIHGSSATPVQGGWNQCQHGGWFFLPWHRIYLYFFERIIRSVVADQGGPSDWALPYWNYDGGGTSNILPAPFRAQNLPDGSSNPLFVPQRVPAINAGAGLPSQATSSTRAMSTINFAPPPAPGFGGGVTGFQHFWNEGGHLELSPHNVVHVVIGGPTGWMGDPNLAALDPIFWLHHANIDRLWVEWTTDASHANPSDAAWHGQSYGLFDESGAAVSMSVADALDTETQLNYRYDTARVPLPTPWPGRYLRFPPMTRGDDVKQWQQRMTTRGVNLAVDGLYGKLSRAACRQFQQQHGLVADGIVGPITWGAVFANP